VIKRAGHLLVKLKGGYAMSGAPAHLDVLAGVSRPLGTIDGGGSIDRCVGRKADAMRVRRAFHARLSLGRMGEQATRFDDTERELGLNKVLALEISRPNSSEALAADLRSLGAVEWAMVEPYSHAPLDANGPLVAWPVTREAVWRPHERVNASRALDIESGDRNILVAVIDTGLALEHPEFAGVLRAGFDTVDLGMGMAAGGIRLIGDSHGRDFCARDETGHGSHVAGILGARGVHIPPGLAGRSFILPIRALAAARVDEQNVVGIGGLLDIDAGIKVALDLGAKVLNMSFGTPRDTLDPHSPPPHADVMRYAVTQGAIPVAAIGNSGKKEKFFPAALPDVIAVGSINEEGRRSAFSSWGRHISLCASGERIISTGLRGYRESTGTSFAAPYVSGTVALLAARAKRFGKELNASTARRLLTDSAQPGTNSHYDEEIGFGLLDAEQALIHLDRLLEN
jgi:subtilisin family serine protease